MMIYYGTKWKITFNKSKSIVAVDFFPNSHQMLDSSVLFSATRFETHFEKTEKTTCWSPPFLFKQRYGNFHVQTRRNIQ